jgi:hypothetical protein
MIIIPTRQICFVHIPRTGGLALQTALEQVYPDAQRHAYDWEHVGAHAVRRILPSPDYRVFTVVRNPWSIFESHWGWVQRYARQPELVDSDAISYGLEIEAALSFPDLVRHVIQFDILATDGGFAARYCDADTIVFRYEADPWADIAAWLECELTMEVVNDSLCEPPVWDQASIDLVGHHCRGDVARFGYVAPITLLT